jgi:hypothetical protein
MPYNPHACELSVDDNNKIKSNGAIAFLEKAWALK